jgi:flagellin
MEVGQLAQEVDRISQTTRFGSSNMLNGTGDKFDIQVGINNDDFNDRISFDASQLNSTASNLGVEGMDFSSKSGAQAALETLDAAQSKLAGFRANVGALQNRYQSTIENLGIQHENLSAANARIRDTDIASATAESARNTILMQSSASVLAQANQLPSMALKLLG